MAMRPGSLVLLLLIACDGHQLVGSTPADLSVGSTPADLSVGAADLAKALDGPASPTMILVKTCCGGPPPLCEDPNDMGMCAHGSGSCFKPGSGLISGCVPPPCTPPPSYYVPLPAACGSNPTCSCFSQDPCAPASCGFVSDGAVQCVCA
jgi:hypothetical protein